MRGLDTFAGGHVRHVGLAASEIRLTTRVRVSGRAHVLSRLPLSAISLVRRLEDDGVRLIALRVLLVGAECS